MQQWRKFMHSSCHKTITMKFLVEEWKLPQYRDMPQGKVLYVTFEETCYKMIEYEWWKWVVIVTDENTDVNLLQDDRI